MSSVSQLLPFTPYFFAAVALAGVLATYFRLKREVAAQAKRNRRVEAMLLRLKEATPSQASRSEAADSEPPVSPASAIRPGMNLSRRVQALRLLRRGEDQGHIAAALGVPLREVELLVRVHQLSLAASASGVESRQAAKPVAPAG